LQFLFLQVSYVAYRDSGCRMRGDNFGHAHASRASNGR
jgi:hypothetical protein